MMKRFTPSLLVCLCMLLCTLLITRHLDQSHAAQAVSHAALADAAEKAARARWDWHQRFLEKDLGYNTEKIEQAKRDWHLARIEELLARLAADH